MPDGKKLAFAVAPNLESLRIKSANKSSEKRGPQALIQPPEGYSIRDYGNRVGRVFSK